jgi:16S rRNA (cytidine1402-2'-O)-methyltransferase
MDGPSSPDTRPGTLYVVATPIGNLGDLSARARSVLSSADIVAAEDTRSTGTLLARLGIPARLSAYHEHNEQEEAARLASELSAGRSVALVSDAGTPGLSDPGFRLVRECRRRGLPVVPVPGPCAAIAALCASGLPTNGFLFTGFLPPRSAPRRAFLARHREFPYTLVVYESCHRIEKALDDIVDTLGPDRAIAVGREITKLHETFLTGGAADVRARLALGSRKGEFVVVIAPEGFAP